MFISLIIIILELHKTKKAPMNKNTDFQVNNQDKSGNFHQLDLFQLTDFNHKRTELSFTQEHTSNDGGLLLLKEVDQQIGLIDQLSSCIDDLRHPGYIKHSLDSMLRQRIMQIAAGYEDANDCNTLKDDGILKICSNSEGSLASQPTMCRLENQPSSKELYKMAKVFIDVFVSSYDTPPGYIILDCDDTSALAYGQQELALFNTYYGDHCFMPLHIYEGMTGKLITTILKPGRRSKSVDVFSIMQKLVNYLHEKWPDTLIILRGDSHFCSKEFMDWSNQDNKIGFITGLSGNKALHELARVTIDSAEREFNQYGKPVKRYHSFEYKAAAWDQPQRVVVKVEVSSMGTNIRYIVSSLRNVRTKALYEQGYCARGSAELRIKDHKTYLLSDRMSCNSFKANQFRLFLHSAAYVLIHALQNQVLRGTEFCKATMKTIQLKILKVAAKVRIMKTKVKIELPINFYSRWEFEKCLRIFEVLRV
jgi:hypothetical protein